MLWLHSLKVAQSLRSAACLHTNQSRSYLNHLAVGTEVPKQFYNEDGLGSFLWNTDTYSRNYMMSQTVQICNLNRKTLF